MSHLHHDPKLLHRIKRLQGQINAIEQAVQNPQKPCIEIVQQVAAVRGAVNGLLNELLEAQLTQHVLTEHGHDAEELAQFIQLMKKYHE